MTADEVGRRLRFQIDYSRANAVLFPLLGLPRRWSWIELVDDGQAVRLIVRMGWAFRATIPVAHVRSLAAAERPFIGWGVHGWRGRWLVNGSLRGIVAIGIDPRARGWVIGVPVRLRTLYISLADPAAFEAAAMARVSSGRPMG